MVANIVLTSTPFHGGEILESLLARDSQTMSSAGCLINICEKERLSLGTCKSDVELRKHGGGLVNMMLQ